MSIVFEPPDARFPIRALGRARSQWVLSHSVARPSEGWAAEAMLRGVYARRVDRDGRIALPRELRRELANGVIIANWRLIGARPSQILRLWSAGEYERFWSRVSGAHDLRSLESRLVSRALAQIREARIDARGRLRLSRDLRRFGGIDPTPCDAIFVGAGDHLELWSKRAWERDSGTPRTGEIEEVLRTAGRRRN